MIETSIEVQAPGQAPIKISGAVQIQMNLENLIKNHAKSVNDLKIELKKTKEMLDDSFNNNPTYREHVVKVKEATKAKNSVRQEIAKQPSVAALAQKVKDIQFDLREQKKTLSSLCSDYVEQTGATQLELFDGRIYQIVVESKLVKASDLSHN
jgi:seryl-tRNA synthetase